MELQIRKTYLFQLYGHFTHTESHGVRISEGPLYWTLHTCVPRREQAMPWKGRFRNYEVRGFRQDLVTTSLPP